MTTDEKLDAMIAWAKNVTQAIGLIREDIRELKREYGPLRIDGIEDESDRLLDQLHEWTERNTP